MNNPYIPNLTLIESIKEETPNIRTFRLRLIDEDLREKFDFKPGQFIELSVFGYGEAPFSISSPPHIKGRFEVTIRKTGVVTSALFSLEEGSVVGIRGPFGRGWPLEEIKGKNLIIIGGGIGIAPLKPVIECIIKDRNKYGNVILLYGARTPKDIVYKEELSLWSNYIDVHLTVDKPGPEWRGKVGVVTTLFDYIKVDPENTYAFQCGPPIMMHFVTKKLLELGIASDKIFLSLERLMKCGMGFCGHCSIGGKYVCRDGPVFSFQEVKGFLEEAI